MTTSIPSERMPRLLANVSELKDKIVVKVEIKAATPVVETARRSSCVVLCCVVLCSSVVLRLVRSDKCESTHGYAPLADSGLRDFSQRGPMRSA